MSEKSKKLINIVSIVIILILILIIIFLLFFWKKDLGSKPSGNVDIFDINCEYNCNCDEEDNNDDFDVENGDGISWSSSEELDIFANPMYEMEEKIAPESTNIYQFVVRNNTKYNVDYSINFIEDNEMNINMKYRLMKNDESYVVGDKDTWVTYEELDLEEVSLKTKKSDTYYLEWKWFESENDTEVGAAGDVDYSLSINISAEQEV